MRRQPAWLLGCAAFVAACGGRGGVPPDVPPLIKGPDGREYHLLERGAYKGFYDRWGRLQRLEYDSNGDSKPDHFAYHDGQKTPHRLEVDEDFDGRIDRWEEYDPAGRLVKLGVSRHHRAAPDLWLTPGPGDLPSKKEYDENQDMRIDRVEHLRAGLIVQVELDANGDGRIDRWQDWSTGRMASESLDTDGDGVADRRIHYDERGRFRRLETLTR